MTDNLFDEMKITILKDGTIKTVTDAVSPANHDNAEQFLAAMGKLAGGKTTVEQRTDVNPTHAHTHEHSHEHFHRH